MLTTGADTPALTSGNDTISATNTTYTSDDVLVDGSTTDADVLNLSVTGNVANTPVVANIETINLSSQVAGALTFDGTNISNLKNLNITRQDLANGQIDGTGAVTINPIKGAGLTVTTVDQVNALTLTQVATSAGATVVATGVTGNVAVTGAATVTANDSTTAVTVATVGNTTQDAKAVSVSAAKAATVTTGALFTGAITVNAAAATTVTVANASGGATVTAATAHATAATVAVEGIDSTGATITVGEGTTTNAMTVQIGGTAATTDTATVKADGAVSLDVGHTVGAVDTVNLAGSTKAVTYTVTSSNGGFTTLAASGAFAVDVSAAGDLLDGKTVTGVDDLTVSAADTGGDNALDLSNVSATNINLAADNANDAITVANNAKVTVTAATQTTGLQLVSKAAGQALTLVAGDNTPTTAQSTTTVNAVDLNGTNDFATVALIAEDSRFVATSFDAAGAAVTITGDQNVTLGTTVVANQINASALTGVLSLTATGVATVTSGSGADQLTLNNNTLMTVDAGNGANVITVTEVAAGSTIVTGTGADTFNIADATGAYVIQGGAGSDTYNLQADADVVIADSEGTGDKLVISSGITDLTNNDNFAFSGIDAMDITAANAAISMDHDDLSGKTIAVTSNTNTDILKAVGTDTAADTIDFSGITITGGGLLQIDGGDKADILTGSNSGTTFLISTGDFDAGEVITGGTGTDIIDASGITAALDLTVGTVTGVETIYIGTQDLTLQQGTGITAIANNATTALGTNAGNLILAKSTTSFKAAAEGTAGAVDVAGEWFLTQDANGDTTLGDNALTYFDEVTGAAVTITLTGVAATNVATASSVLGNLVVDIA